MWRRTSLLALCMELSRAAGQTSVPPVDVEYFIQQAFARNREILAAQQRVTEAQGLLRQAGIRPVPTVEVSAGSGRPLGTKGEEDYAVGYFQTIETGGKRSKRVAVAQQGVELANADMAERMRQLAFEIRSRFIDAVASREKLEAIERIVAVNRESYRLVDARVQRDDAAPLERQLLLVEVNRVEAQRAAASGQVAAAKLELRRAVAVNVDESVPDLAKPLVPPDIDASLDEIARKALQIRADLRAARVLESQFGAELELADALSSPNFTLSAQYTRRYSQFEDPIRTAAPGSPLLLQDRDNVLTIGVSVPLQSRKRNQGNLEAAAARRSAGRLRSEHLQLTIPLEIRAAWQRFQAARTAIGVLNRGVLRQAEQNLSVIRQAYSLGQLRLIDVLNEQRKLLEMQLSYIDAEAELARSFSELERSAGGEVR